MQMRTLAARWHDLEERRRRAADAASGDSHAAGDRTVLSWGKHTGKTFAEAWLDQAYVKWCCEHMRMSMVGGNQLAWLIYVSERIAAEVEMLDMLGPDAATAVAETTTSRRLAAVEARVLSMEQTLVRLVASVASLSDRTPGGEEPPPPPPPPPPVTAD